MYSFADRREDRFRLFLDTVFHTARNNDIPELHAKADYLLKLMNATATFERSQTIIEELAGFLSFLESIDVGEDIGKLGALVYLSNITRQSTPALLLAWRNFDEQKAALDLVFREVSKCINTTVFTSFQQRPEPLIELPLVNFFDFASYLMLQERFCQDHLDKIESHAKSILAVANNSNPEKIRNVEDSLVNLTVISFILGVAE